MTFAHPAFLWLLCALPLLALWRGRRGRRAAIEYPTADVVREVAKVTRSRFGSVLLALRLLAAGAFIVALARPQLAQAKRLTQASGVDLVLAVDVSSSMDAQDMTLGGVPSDRLSAVKAVVEKFVAARPNDRIGLIAFAGGPYLVSPPTLDHDWLLDNLARLKTGVVKDGTAVGSALTASVNRLRDKDSKSRVVVLLTDGMSNAGAVAPALAAQAAAAEHVKVYTIGVGSDGKALMPVKDDDGRTRMVMTEVDVDEDTLRHIAQVTHGRFFRATDTESLASVYAEIDAMEKTTRTVETRLTHHERFQWPALAGLGFFGLELLGAFAYRRRLP
jgi:Ca-activated chloride channel family protein